MSEIDIIAERCLSALKEFTSRLEPRESTSVAMESWKRQYHYLLTEVRSIHAKKSQEVTLYERWKSLMLFWIQILLGYVYSFVMRLFSLAQLSTRLVVKCNLYLWKKSFNLLRGKSVIRENT